MATPRKIRCSVDIIESHGAHVYTLHLTPERELPRFEAGQFLQMTIDAYDPSAFWPESRAFSIASHPRERDRIEIVYSTVGTYTKRMEEELRVGSEVWVKLPYGEFVIHADRDLALIAGGTGISAFTSFLRDLDPTEADGHRVHLLYGARVPALLLHAEEFQAKAALGDRMTVDLMAESAEGAPAVTQGRISVDRIWERLANAAERVFYLSGPPPMIAAISQGLRDRGCADEQIRIDAWE